MTSGQKSYLPFKRIFDVTAAVIALILLSPLFIILMIAVKISDGGPVFFLHERVGLNNKKFKIIKFRSMKENADEDLKRNAAEYEKFKNNGYKYKNGNDPRVTKLGHFLRRSSLDELPQFINILKGDMSLVGPRPVTEPELINYKGNVDKFLSVRPGALGLWQSSGRSDVGYPKRAQLDLEYVDKLSPTYDIYIIFKNIISIFTRQGAY